MKLAIIGCGYVGLVAGACFAAIGHEVTLVDNDPNKIADLQCGQCPIHEQWLPNLLSMHRSRMTFTGCLEDAVAQSQAVFIAVGTPDDGNGNADLSYVEAVARQVAKALKQYTVIVEKSTVPVQTSAHIRETMLRNGADPTMFDVASNPEFLKEGTAVNDFLYPDRIVIGTSSPRAASVLREIYHPITHNGEVMLIETSVESAELIKHASNAFLAMKISFINAVANICELAGANIDQVVKGIGTDSRIGHQFLKPGIGYGGSCFPKDTKAFYSVAASYGYDFRMLKEVMQLNDDQLTMFLHKICSALWTLRGKKIGVLGMAFKGGTDDTRESPAMAIIERLLKEGCTIKAYDPVAMEKAKQYGLNIIYADSAYHAATGADALLILTDWHEFAELDLQRLHSIMDYPIVVDGRNLYDPQQMEKAGIKYYSVGRP